MNLTLTREPSHGNAVRGVLSPLGYETLENLNYLIPVGTYRIAVTWSPRFKRPLPLVCDVVGAPDAPSRPRSGIRFHLGTRPEHSRGCVLLRTAKELDTLTGLIQSEPSTITIT